MPRKPKTAKPKAPPCHHVCTTTLFLGDGLGDIKDGQQRDYYCKGAVLPPDVAAENPGACEKRDKAKKPDEPVTAADARRSHVPQPKK